jgi:ABC-2 type transport system permease protein
MRNVLTIWRRELAACFLSPIAYVLMVMFLATTGFTFFLGVVRNTGSVGAVPPLLFGAMVLGMGALVPAVTMRLFAEEKRAGTIETLMTAPVTESDVVLGKYAGALSFMILVAAPAVANVFILERLSPGLDLETVDLGALAGGALIYLLLALFFTALGLFISLMTRNQVVAAVCCFVCCQLALFLGWLLSILPGSNKGLADYVSATTHLEDFCRGIVDLRPIVLYLSATWLLLFCSVRVLESRQWR